MEATEHAFTLNPAGTAVTHAAFDGARPLCGFSEDDEAISPEWAEVTCRDCLAARGE